MWPRPKELWSLFSSWRWFCAWISTISWLMLWEFNTVWNDHTATKRTYCTTYTLSFVVNNWLCNVRKQFIFKFRSCHAVCAVLNQSWQGVDFATYHNGPVWLIGYTPHTYKAWHLTCATLIATSLRSLKFLQKYLFCIHDTKLIKSDAV